MHWAVRFEFTLPFGLARANSWPMKNSAESPGRSGPPIGRPTGAVMFLVLGVFWGVQQTVGAAPATPDDLRLVPFPKHVELARGSFQLRDSRAIEVHPSVSTSLGTQLQTELRLAGFVIPLAAMEGTSSNTIRIARKTAQPTEKDAVRADATDEDYLLKVTSDSVTVTAPAPTGLVRGVQTLRQLVRANRVGDALPCLTIRDWPALRWRAFQDDLTRGPSTKMESLRSALELATFFKLNLFTYYMEYQFAFEKHPDIGPPDGSLTRGELRALTEFGRPLHIEILGNQQSFGHFTAILAHPRYAPLRETEYLLCPTNDGTYALLDELYSEVIPLLSFPWFNVCCDETNGLGEGPSKPVAERIGVGALYVQHIRRLHQLVSGKYGKRMMMWGDIILRHPEQIPNVPKDVIMLTWGYDPRSEFEDQIAPFARSGHEFMVCPGVNCWSRVLPHFAAAVTNIHNFVRDGCRMGTIGMLNTAWDDDGESFNAPNWHGIAWGAECAWNAAATPYHLFNKRLGAVLFGERGDSFGRAISNLSNPRICGLPNRVFWQADLDPVSVDRADKAIDRWRAMLDAVRPAIEDLQACKREATANADLLDYFVFGARRIETYARARLQHIEAALAYRNARNTVGDAQTNLLHRAELAIRDARQAHTALRTQFTALWDRENKPYARDWTLRRYDGVLARYDTVLERLADARAKLVAGQLLPSPKEVGLELVETGH